MQNKKMKVNTLATFGGKYSYHSKCPKNNSITVQVFLCNGLMMATAKSRNYSPENVHQ